MVCAVIYFLVAPSHCTAFVGKYGGIVAVVEVKYS